MCNFTTAITCLALGLLLDLYIYEQDILRDILSDINWSLKRLSDIENSFIHDTLDEDIAIAVEETID